MHIPSTAGIAIGTFSVIGTIIFGAYLSIHIDRAKKREMYRHCCQTILYLCRNSTFNPAEYHKMVTLKMSGEHKLLSGRKTYFYAIHPYCIKIIVDPVYGSEQTSTKEIVDLSDYNLLNCLLIKKREKGEKLIASLNSEKKNITWYHKKGYLEEYL